MKTNTEYSTQNALFRVPSHRRGVVLLVILGMLAALALIGIAFTTFSAQEEDASRTYGETFKNRRADLDPMVVILEALSQLIADTNNPHSGVRGHSLLRDMYGNDNDWGVGPDGMPGISGMDDDQDGITDNISELGWTGSDDAPNGVIDPFDWYVRAFNGIGEVGPDGIPGTADDADINYIFNTRQPEMATFSANNVRRGAGADEDFDFANHDNMFMSVVRADGRCFVPSFHRPGYLQTTPTNDWTDTTPAGNGAARGRRLIVRPRQAEHTVNFPYAGAPAQLLFLGFDGLPGRAGIDDDSNGTTDDFGEIGWPGSDDLPWDVDNNGDGIPDSIWVDIGFPVQTTLNGRKFKPLVAFMVMDMDGKLNLNAHGNLNYAFSHHMDFPVGATVPLDRIPLGSGASVTEINLENLFWYKYFPSVYGSGDTEYRQLFEGAVRAGGSPIKVPGKWGEVGLVGTSSLTPVTPRPGRSGVDDDLRAVSPIVMPGGFLGFPGTNTMDNIPRTSGGYFATPGDIDGDGGKYLQLVSGGWRPNVIFGRASVDNGWGNDSVWSTFWNVQGETTNTSGQEGVDDPSEFNLYSPSSNDSPFTPADIESAYRFQDVDGSQLIGWSPGMTPAGRLAVLAPKLFDPANPTINRRRRYMIGVGNWDVRNFNMPPVFPRDSTAMPNNFATWQAAQFNGAFPDLFRNVPILAQRFGTTAIEGPAIPDAIRRGKRLNVAPLLRNYNDKYRLFRDLYVVMIELCGADVPAHRVAQWCANVVGFQDTEVGDADLMAEEKMEAYEFDNRLFDSPITGPNDGFLVDGNHLTTGGDGQPGDSDVVWSAEAPRVVISETLAYEDPAGNVKLFIELYNISDRTVDLKGLNNTYELVWGDGTGDPSSDGEPDNSFLGNRMDFSLSGGPNTTTIPPGGYLLIGPESTPAKLSGGNSRPVDFQPQSSFGPAAPGPYRLFLRRLADPKRAEDNTNRSNFPRSDNPYITIDALDFFVWEDARFNNPMIVDVVSGVNIGYGTVVSKERESLSVKNNYHLGASTAPATTHSLGLLNSNVTEAMPTISWLDRPLASPLEIMLVPGVGVQHITTAYAPSNLSTNLYIGQGAGGEDSSDLETGEPRTSPFKNSDSDYLYSYLLNFFREDPNGKGPPPGKGKGKGKKKGLAKRATSSTPTPGFYRILEFIDVPSHMAGARDLNNQENPGSTGGYSLMDRVVGRININTMWEQEILQAACNNHPVSLDQAAASRWYPYTIPTFNNGSNGVQGAPAPFAVGTTDPDRERGMVTSELWRRILMSIANPMTTIQVGSRSNNVTIPAGDGILFTPDDRPFRGGTLGYPNTSGMAISGTRPPSIQDTIFRGLPADVGGDPRPIFSNDIAGPPPGLDGVGGAPADLSNYPDFQWQLYQRVSNMFTTRSNTYAVWITIGFFEVVDKDLNGDGDVLDAGESGEDPNRLLVEFPGSGLANAPPRLGAEINLDTGQNIRHRAFFIIDRSRARGYLGPPRSSEELQDILSQVVVHSRMIE